MYIVLSIIAVAAALIGAGFLYQVIGSHRDRRRFASAGRWVEIGQGHRLYMLEKGSGGPTVLFEAGIAATNLNWFHIQEIVARFTHTVSYDRGGLGWSGPSRSARTPGNCASELHDLLQRANITPPFVLVGHSFGGLVMRRYALCYPEEVTGIVLVDPMRCEEWPPLNPGRQREVDRGKRLTGFAVPIARFGLARLAVTSLLCRSGKISGQLAGAAGKGGRHVLDRVTEEVGKMPREVWPIIAAHWSRPGYYVGMRDHVEAVPDTVREMQDAEPIRDIPVLLLTPGKSTPLSDEDVLRIGDNVQQVIAADSAHWIHLDEPDLVIQSIREMVAAVAAEPVAASI
ncbi:MAG TPA: alpha/beta hydrolase [Terracidiphilus sp.]|nr:alpha/beta hydrolase [Terracidiphilus sp.]